MSFTVVHILRLLTILLVLTASARLVATEHRARQALDRALYLSELYNWTAAAADYAEAEHLFTAAGDQRNAFYARLGRIRANVEADQNVAATSVG